MANEAKQFTIGGVTHDVMDVGARQAIASLQNAIDAITSGDTTTAIKTFQEVIDFLDGVTDDATLIGKLNELRTLIAAKYSKPASGIPASDLADGVIPDVSGFATKTEVNTKANSSEVYSKSETDAAIQEAVEGIEAGETVVINSDGANIVDEHDNNSVLFAPSARQMKLMYNNFIALYNSLANIAFTNGKPTLDWIGSKTKYTLTMTALTGCTGEVLSGDAGNGQVYEGGVRIKLTPTTAYTFASIKVNGEDVASTPTGDSDNSVYIDIIANQDITVSATAVSGFAIAVSGSHVTNTQSHSGSTYTVTLGSDNQHFHLPDTIVVKHGQTVLTVTHYTYNKTTGEVVISNVNDGTYSIEVTMVEDAKYNVTLDATGLTGATAILSASQVYAGENATITITPNEGYTLNSVKYAINSGTQQTATITNNQAVITIENINVATTVAISGNAAVPSVVQVTKSAKYGSITGNDTVTAGGQYQATITPNQYFGLKSGNVVVKINNVVATEGTDYNLTIDPSTYVGTLVVQTTGATQSLDISVKCAILLYKGFYNAYEEFRADQRSAGSTPAVCAMRGRLEIGEDVNASGKFAVNSKLNGVSMGYQYASIQFFDGTAYVTYYVVNKDAFTISCNDGYIIAGEKVTDSIRCTLNADNLENCYIRYYADGDTANGTPIVLFDGTDADSYILVE